MDWKRETGRDFNLNLTQTPENVGPGSYDISSERKTPRTSRVAFGSTTERNINLSKTEITPSPGAYEYTVSSSRSASSVFHSSTKRDIFSPSENPSPADYSLIKDWCPKKSAPIKAKIEKVHHDSPNFGQDVSGYIQEEDGTLRAVKKVRKDETYLAPGTYNPSEPTTSRTHQMKEPYRDFKFGNDSGTPGPGSYSPTERNTKMRSQIRARSYKTEAEPPLSGNLGHTEWAKDRRPTSNFSSKSKRDCFSGVSDTPAPTAYQHESMRRAKSSTGGFGQKSKRFEEINDTTPGPGQYEGKPVKWVHVVSGKNGTIRKRQRDVHEEDQTPGPGSYNISSKWGEKKRPSSSFGKSKRRTVASGDETPGPGAYEIDRSMCVRGMEIHCSRLDHGSMFATSSRDTPAPDSYGTVSSLSSRGYSIPRGDRFKGTTSDTPGPGSYEIGQKSLVKKSYNADYLHMKY